MKLLLINSVCGTGSTGRICVDIAREYEKKGYEVKIAYGRSESVPEEAKRYAVRIGNKYEVYAHALYTRLTDRHGFGSKIGTKRFLKWADKFNPDIVWLHNIHGYYINIELLFNWIKDRNITHPKMEIKWTLHDCWTMTGHCAYFTVAGCEKWKTRCINCPQRERYPESFVDRSNLNYKAKKELFTGLKNLTLITPSMWLANLTRESFLKEYPVTVKYNTIDTDTFRKIEKDDERLVKLRERYGLESKRVILGVSNVWDRRKGLNDLIKLSCLAGEEFATVIIGLNPKQIREIDKTIQALTDELKSEAQSIERDLGTSLSEENSIVTDKGIAVKAGIGNLLKGFLKVTNRSLTQVEIKVPKIVCIPHTKDKEELARFYNLADIFVNPTYEDNYPTVNLEAIACGTKVLTYDVGGSGETIK